MNFTDQMTLDGGLRRTREGYAVLSARVARGGNVQVYTGDEMGKPERQAVRVYRPEDAVFSRDAMSSYAGVAVTVGHPKDDVTAANWRELGVGEVGGDEIVRDGEFVRVPMMLRDAKAIDAVEAGQRELSMGYKADLVWQDGVSPAGEAYDALMTNFRMNHVAIVDRARGGAELRIGDGVNKWGAAPVLPTTDKETITMSDALRTVVVDGLSVSTTDQGAQAITKLLKDLESSAAKISDAETAHAAIIKAKDEEIGTLKADLKKAQDAAPKPADLDKMVSDRVALVTAAKAIDKDIVTDGKSDLEIRKATVAAKYGDEFVKDASEGEIGGMFKALTKDSGNKSDPVHDALKSQDRTAVNDAWSDSVFASAGIKTKKEA